VIPSKIAEISMDSIGLRWSYKEKIYKITTVLRGFVDPFEVRWSLSE